jgi:hypothetical protein
MLSPVDYVIWFVAVCADVCCAVCIVKKKALSQNFTIFLFFSASAAIGVSRYLLVETAGFASNSYFYFYYYSDAVLTICLFIVLMSLYAEVFSELGVGKLVRAGALLLLGGTALISYYMVASSSERLVTKFAFQLSQNLYFVGVVLTYVLWGAMMKMRENRTRLMQLVLALGVYLSAFAGSYALRSMYHPASPVWRYLIASMALWLPVSWAYTFIKVPADARMATARVVAPTR